MVCGWSHDHWSVLSLGIPHLCVRPHPGSVHDVIVDRGRRQGDQLPPRPYDDVSNGCVCGRSLFLHSYSHTWITVWIFIQVSEHEKEIFGLIIRHLTTTKAND